VVRQVLVSSPRQQVTAEERLKLHQGRLRLDIRKNFLIRKDC